MIMATMAMVLKPHKGEHTNSYGLTGDIHW